MTVRTAKTFMPVALFVAAIATTAASAQQASMPMGLLCAALLCAF